MTARATMTHRALVERGVSVGTDDFGHPNPPAWDTHIASLPCRLWTKSEREIADGNKLVILAVHKLLVPLNTDITESDRIASIKDRLGNTLVGNLMLIRSVIRKETHLELDLEEVSSG